MLQAISKPNRRRPVAQSWLVGVCLTMTGLACSAPGPARVVSAVELSEAARAATLPAGRSVVTDVSRLQPLLTRVAPELGVIQVRTPADWELLRSVAPALGPPPALEHGMVVGLVSLLGRPLGVDFPIEIHAVRVLDRAGCVSGTLTPGTFFPDALAFVDTAYVPDLHAVVMMEVNGIRYYPEP